MLWPHQRRLFFISLRLSLSLSLCALINGHSFSSVFFLFFLLFTAPLPQLDTLHLVQSPNLLTAVPVSCDVSVSAHGELQLCIEVCTQSVKYFGHPSGTTSFRLCRCQLGGKGTGSARQGRRFVACTGLHVLLTPLTLSSPFLSLLLPLCCLQCFSLAMHIFPFFNLLLLLLVCFLSLPSPTLSPSLCPALPSSS